MEEMMEGNMEEKNVQELFDMKVAHVGINAACKEESRAWAELFCRLMGLPVIETPVSYFAGDLVEIMNENGRGTHGHIGISVNDVEKAMAYFEKRGMTPVDETKKFDENGKCTFVYFKEEIGGFAIHLRQG